MKKRITQSIFIVFLTMLCAWNLNAQEMYNIPVYANPYEGGTVTGEGNLAYVAYFEPAKGEDDKLSITPIDAGAMKIYPNPTNSDMTIVLTNSDLKIVEMELYDITGRKVDQQTVNQSSGILNLNEVGDGTYILKLLLDQGDVVTWG